MKGEEGGFHNIDCRVDIIGLEKIDVSWITQYHTARKLHCLTILIFFCIAWTQRVQDRSKVHVL